MPDPSARLASDLLAAAQEDPTQRELRALLRRDSTLDILAEDVSTISHVLGFVQFRIGSVQGQVVRLHFWMDAQHAADDVHTHLWPLTSYVIDGVIRNEFHTVEQERAAQRRLYKVTYQAQGTRREPTQSLVESELRTADHFGRGESYRVALGEFHASSVRSDSAVTMIVSGQPSQNLPLVVGPATDPHWPDYPLIAPSPPLRQKCLNILRDALRT